MVVTACAKSKQQHQYLTESKGAAGKCVHVTLRLTVLL